MPGDKENSYGAVVVGKVRAGRFFDGDSVIVNGSQVGGGREIDLANAPEFIELDMRIVTLEKNGCVYQLIGRNEANTKWKMKRLTEEELEDYRAKQAVEAKDKAQKKVENEQRAASSVTEQKKPTWESIKDQYPEGSITSDNFVGGRLQYGDRFYRMAQPMVQTTTGYVYVPL